MSTEVRLRRGNTAQHGSFTGALAEVTVDTDLKTLRVHDGVTPGGSRLATIVDIPIPTISRTALKTIDTNLVKVVILMETGREGVFVWKAGNFSTQIAADTAEGVYIKANAVSAAAGAWVREGDWPTAGADARWFGVVADGVTNCAAAINAALAIADTVMLPPGSIAVGAVITLPRDNTHLKGAGMFSTTLLSSTTNAEIIAIPAGSTNRRVTGLTGRKNVTPVSGGWGLRTVGTSANCEFVDVQMRNCYQGFRLSACDVGFLRHCLAQENVLDGFFLTNESGYGPCQWGFHDILAQANGRDGVRVQTVAGPAGLILGTWSDIRTFANTGFGISFLGISSCGIFDIRASNIFVGGDNQGCLYIDTYGGGHRINGFIEYAGESVNGPGLANPAGHNAAGISITANNTDVTFYGTTIRHNALQGIFHAGGSLVLSGCVIDTNGMAAVASSQYGVYTTGGRLVANGNRIGNFAGTIQKYGIVGTHNNVVITGNDLSGNGTAATFGMSAPGVIANNI